mmetsp:Transcript_13110/g.37376  ORF Transcript_13110/g.37376 Transcript_13110/m.37376 type:complete len:572 (-) Transcript_13110:25-1740(-)
MNVMSHRSSSDVSDGVNDVRAAADEAEAEAGASLLPKGKFKILELIDGILIEPGSYDDGKDDDGTATDDGDASTAASAFEMGELLPSDADAAKNASGVTDLWTCPGATPDGASCNAPGKDPRCTHSAYGRKIDKSVLEGEIGEDKDGGFLYTVRILPNDYNSGKKLKHLLGKDYDEKGKQPKPRRKMPFPITTEQFFSSITRIGKPSLEIQAEGGYDDLWDRDVRHSMQTMSIKKDETGGPSPRWMLSGVINGWPGLGTTPLEIRKIEGRESKSFVGRRMGWSTLWDCEKDGKGLGKDPSYSKSNLDIRARLRAPVWSAHGWSHSSPGFVFWVEGQTCLRPDAPLTVTYGTDLISHFKCEREEDDPLNTKVHMISHRYATGGRNETQRERLTYHTLILLEWNHSKYCTVVEIGYLNGLSGYKGKSNWYSDKDAPQASRLYAAFPPEMILPWKETMSEIRIHDVPYKDVDSFLLMMKSPKYEGHTGRFVDIQHTFSHETRLTYRSRRNIATYLLNYIRRDRTYSEIRRNCQTFAADFSGFLAGKGDVQPFHAVNQVAYTCHKHFFLYEPLKY